MPKTIPHSIAVPNAEQQRLLCDTVYGADSPGPILHDFQTLLDFIGSQGIEASGKFDLLPIKILPTLNLHMRSKVEVDLERGQLRSYPNLQGLYLLARATGLIVVAAHNTKRKLVVEPASLQSWQSLNPTEQYFSLLDAWLTKASRDMIGEDRGFFDHMLDSATSIWERVGESGKQFSVNDRANQGNWFAMSSIAYSLAMPGLFGLVEIKQGKAIKGRSWIPASMRQTAFGQAVFRVLQTLSARRHYSGSLEEFLLLKPHVAKRDAETDADTDDDTSDPQVVRFDELQELFGPYVPAWKNSLCLSFGGFREGLFVFRVSYAKAWSRIAIPAKATLQDLADAILDAMDFDDEHLWAFSLRDRFGSPMKIEHPFAEPEDLVGDEVRIGDIPLCIGQTMEFQYDYGDDWRFQVLLEKIDAPTRAKKYKITESVGRPPRQYDFDDEDDDDDYE